MLKLKLYIFLVAVFTLQLAGYAQITPDEAIKKLTEGNKRYVTSSLKQKNYDIQREEQKEGQFPYAIILTCSDSRVPPELIFDEDLGKLFVIRVAGNVIDEVTLGSIEYAAEHLHTQLLVILGHSSCGAVKAALGGGDLGKNLNVLAGKIKPAAESAKTKSKNKNLILSLAVEGNVELQADNALAESSILKELVHENKLKILGGIYDIENGSVSFFEPEAKPVHTANHNTEKNKSAKEYKHELIAPAAEKKHESEKPSKTEEEHKENNSTGYNFEKDENVKDNIFTDGKKFCVQLSSWKSKLKAEREAAKLRHKKNNVFIMQYTNPQTNENWFRVRVGSFSTVYETEKYITMRQ